MAASIASAVTGDGSSMDLVGLTADMVSAFVANNHATVDQTVTLIGSVHRALLSLGDASAVPAPVETGPIPAVPIKSSVKRDYIVCLEDGMKLRMLKRHLRTSFGMTPEEYRTKWGLPADYPMTAPAYSEKRSQMAKTLGLGRKKPAPVVQVKPVRKPRAKRA